MPPFILIRFYFYYSHFIKLISGIWNSKKRKFYSRNNTNNLSTTNSSTMKTLLLNTLSSSSKKKRKKLHTIKTREKSTSGHHQRKETIFNSWSNMEACSIFHFGKGRYAKSTTKWVNSLERGTQLSAEVTTKRWSLSMDPLKVF